MHLPTVLTIALILIASNVVGDEPARAVRTPSEVLAKLSQHYGRRYAGSYLQSLAILARMQHEGDAVVESILRPALKTAPTIKSGSQIAGQLAFGRWARTEPAAEARVIAVANLGIEKRGRAKQFMPTHNEMSDAIFMACPLLCDAGSLTGKSVYFEAAWNHLQTMRGFCLRDDGLYRHSPLDESAWGRGNGFPALGLAFCLERLPKQDKRFEGIRGCLIDHLTALRNHQDDAGLWHQVIDHPESYAEFTCTCMIGVAIAKCIELGVLDRDEWLPVVQKAWFAIERRISEDGRELAGCCTGTGKQRNLEAYLNRKEIHGFDERGGAMAMLLALEMRSYLD